MNIALRTLATLATALGLAPASTIPAGNKSDQTRRAEAAHAGGVQAPRKRAPKAYRSPPPVLPVVPFYDRPTPPGVVAHRAGIAAAARGAGPMFTPKGSPARVSS